MCSENIYHYTLPYAHFLFFQAYQLPAMAEINLSLLL